MESAYQEMSQTFAAMKSLMRKTQHDWDMPMDPAGWLISAQKLAETERNNMDVHNENLEVDTDRNKNMYCMWSVCIYIFLVLSLSPFLSLSL